MDAKVSGPLNQLGAAEIVQKIARGETTCEAVVRDCLARIAERDGVVKAWVNFDPELALAPGARARSRAEPRSAAWRADRRQGHHRHLRHADRDGLADLRGHRPPSDAACVALLRRAGAVILGKTVTCEFAGMAPPADHQSAQSGAYAGRLVERLGRGGGRPHGAGRARHPDRRLGAAAGLLLRRLRLQADLQHVQQSRREAGGGKHRHHRLARALARRHRAAHRRAAHAGAAAAAHDELGAADRLVPHRDVG